MKMTIKLKTGLVKILLLVFLTSSMLSCRFLTKKDKHPEVETLDQLVGKKKISIVEDYSIENQKSIILLNDSLYATTQQNYEYIESLIPRTDSKKTNPTLKITNTIQIKNLITQKNYLTRTFANPVLINNNFDLLTSDSVYYFPLFNAPKKIDSLKRNEFIQLSSCPNYMNDELEEFDSSIIYEWVSGRLPSPSELYYYKVGDMRFKSTSQCYYIEKNRKFFFSYGVGIVKLP